MTRGQLFGELALLYNTPRTATVRAGSAASVWVLTRSVYQGILTGEAMDRTQTTIEQLRVQVPRRRCHRRCSFHASYLTPPPPPL